MFCSGGSLTYFARIETKQNFSGCEFFNTNLPEERVQVILSEKRTWNGKHSILNEICHAKLLA